MALLCATLLALAAGSLRAEAQAYRYTDERGVLHFTDSINTVPERFRSELEEIEMPDEGNREGRARGSGRGSPASGLFVGRMLDGEQQRLFERHQEKAQEWLDSWGRAFIVSALPWMAVTLGVAVHALLRRRFLWAFTNLALWVVSVPLYVLLRMDHFGLPQRLGLLALWCAPFVVGALALHAAARMFTA